MVRFISLLLVLTLSLGGLAWATDSHDEALLGQAACVVHDGDLSADADHGCDHCCHGAAHLLAVLPAGPLSALPVAGVTHLPAATTLASRAAQPLLQPPRPAS
jgi:hypothetical protein